MNRERERTRLQATDPSGGQTPRVDEPIRYLKETILLARSAGLQLPSSVPSTVQELMEQYQTEETNRVVPDAQDLTVLSSEMFNPSQGDRHPNWPAELAQIVSLLDWDATECTTLIEDREDALAFLYHLDPSKHMQVLRMIDEETRTKLRTGLLEYARRYAFSESGDTG